MRITRLAILAAMTPMIPLTASGAPQRFTPQIRIPGKVVITPAPAPVKPAPQISAIPVKLNNVDLVRTYVELTNAPTPPVPQTKIRFSALHMRDPGYAQFHNADVLAGNLLGLAMPDGVVVMGNSSDATFILPNSPDKPYLMDCSVGGPMGVGPPAKLDYYATGYGSAPVTNGHMLFVVPAVAGMTLVTVSSKTAGSWFLFSCEATLMG